METPTARCKSWRGVRAYPDATSCPQAFVLKEAHPFLTELLSFNFLKGDMPIEKKQKHLQEYWFMGRGSLQQRLK